ncbi:MAG: hypothetical protein ACPGVH_05115 [Chitinophagales bacterium]
MNLLVILSFFVQSDSLIQVSSNKTIIDNNKVSDLPNDSLVSKSIMFVPKQNLNTNSYKYKHIQGFFCDFEDKVNKDNKININVGVGAQ